MSDICRVGDAPLGLGYASVPRGCPKSVTTMAGVSGPTPRLAWGAGLLLAPVPVASCGLATTRLYVYVLPMGRMKAEHATQRTVPQQRQVLAGREPFWLRDGVSASRCRTGAPEVSEAGHPIDGSARHPLAAPPWATAGPATPVGATPWARERQHPQSESSRWP